MLDNKMDSGSRQTEPFDASGNFKSSVRASTTGGMSMHRRISTADVNAANIKDAAGQVYFVHCGNVNAAVRYLKLYNKATAPSEADTPVMTIVLPASNASPPAISFHQGVSFALGIGIRLVTGLADNDTGAASANEHVIHIGYK